MKYPLLIDSKELMLDIWTIPEDVMRDSTKTLIGAYVCAQQAVPAIPVSFIHNEIERLEALAGKMDLEYRAEIDLQINTLRKLMMDYGGDVE